MRPSSMAVRRWCDNEDRSMLRPAGDVWDFEPLPGASFTDSKTAKAPEFDLAAFIQTFDDTFEDNFNQSLSVLLGEFSGAGYVVDKISFGHAFTSPKQLKFT